MLRARFAAYAAEIEAVQPVPCALREAQRSYSHTYDLEDNYLRALVAAIPERAFGSLPHTAELQRRVIVAWRLRLHAVADRLGVALPEDLEVAGRGEIAPSPLGE